MVHVCFVYTDGTGNSAKFVGTAMFSIFENISKPLPSVTVHILHDNTLTADVRNKFFYFAGRCSQVIKFYNVEELCADKIEKMHSLFPNANRFPNAMFYKLLVPQILPTETDKAIYLEANTIVNMDISELWRVELGENMLAAVPALAIGSDIHTQDRAAADGFIKPEDYFNPGVMLMNLKLLRGEWEKIFDGLKFAAEHKYLSLLEQTVLNYCFSTQTVKLPAQFNQFVRWARRRREPVRKGIYYYTAYTLQLDMKDPFNLLWMEYFVKTPWFDAASIGRLYEGFQQVHISLKKSMENISLIVSNKARAFCVVPGYVDELKKIF
ncbi:MAG: hypothetical protein IJT47_04360, partial [Selenomonadaceae bacterium]|nr:hypothetical protein [Selenomonadaceae bacterium]